MLQREVDCPPHAAGCAHRGPPSRLRLHDSRFRQVPEHELQPRRAGDLRLSDSYAITRRGRSASDRRRRSLRSTPLGRANHSANAALGASNELQIGAGLVRWAAREPSPASVATTKGTGGSAAAGRTPIARDRRGGLDRDAKSPGRGGL